MDRRDLLTLCGVGLAGFAGCASTQPDGQSTPDDTPSRTPGSPTGSTSTTTPSAELHVQFDALQEGVLELNVDYFGILQFMDNQ